MNYTPQVDRRGGFRPGISPKRWGPVVWDTLHFISLGYPIKDPSPEVRQAAQEFLRALPFLLPCKVCREHLAEAYMDDLPLQKEVFASRQNFGEYIVVLRDLVKRKHVCPGCDDLKQHSFPEDVEDRLLSDKSSHPPKWILMLSFIALFMGYRFLRRTKHGK